MYIFARFLVVLAAWGKHSTTSSTPGTLGLHSLHFRKDYSQKISILPKQYREKNIQAVS